MEIPAKQILDLALRANEVNGYFHKKIWDCFSLEEQTPERLYRHLRDFQTIVLGLPHRTGKTTAVAQELLPGDLLVLSNTTFIQEHRRDYPHQHLVDILPRYYLTKNYLPAWAKGKVYNRVFIDTWSLPSPAFLRNAIKLLGHNIDQQFIVVF